MALSDPPPYTPDTSEQNPMVRSNSLAQSATNLISKVLNVAVDNNVPYLVSGTEIICSICLENMDEEEGNLFTVPKCSHAYHKHCIIEWKQQSDKCPCCRGPLPDTFGSTSSEVQELLVDPVIPEMTRSDIQGNVIFFLPGIVYVLCLVLLLSACEYALIGIIAFFATVDMCVLDEGCFGILYSFILIATYPCVVLVTVYFFLVQSIYVLYWTMHFYYKVLTCSIRWNHAYSFIIGRTLTWTNSYCNTIQSDYLMSFWNKLVGSFA